ncbi:MAG: hypothetical protein ACRD8Z_02035 [Nitrososphaeraceae archaeon]
MASYGFGFNNEGWMESKKDSLAKALRGLLEDMEGEDKFIVLVPGQKPYVQVDEPYPGVTIMNLTYVAKEFQHDLIERAEKRYKAVMSGENEDSEGYVLSKNI